MKYFLLLALLIVSSELFGQSNICVPDSSTEGKFIDRLIREGESGVSITKKSDGTKLKATRLCEHHYMLLDSLDRVLTDSQVNQLIECDNGTLTIAGFILFTNRATSKAQVSDKLSFIIKSSYRIVSNGCSDALQTGSLSKFCLDLLKSRNSFIRVDHNFSKKELSQLENEVRKREEQYWKK